MTPRSPRLSYDILLELLQHVPRQSDVSTLMRTCRTLWESGSKVLLTHGVTVENQNQLHSFCAFVLGDIPTRAAHLRRLYIKIRLEPLMDDESEEDSDAENSYSGATISNDTLEMLFIVLQKATNLQDLSIDSCEELLECKEELTKAIIALEQIRRLQVHSVGTLTGSVLDGIKSSLVEIDLHCYSEEMYDPEVLIPMAKHHCATLEKLSGWYVELGDATVQYPRVRALALRSFWGLDTAALHQAFPSLQYLELSVPADLDADPMRLENKDASNNHPWGVLRRLCGAIDALYALGTAPRARVVEVDYIGSYRSKTLARLRTILSEARPSHAVLHLGYNYGFSLSARKIPGLLPLEDASVTHLVLDIRISSVTGTADEVLSNLVSLLRRQQLTFLVLRLHDTLEGVEDPTSTGVGKDGDDTNGDSEDEDREDSFRHNDDEDGPVNPAPPKNSSEQDILRTFGRPRQEEIVGLFSEAGSSLKHIVLDVKGREATYWTVKRTDAGFSIEQLSAVAGRALMHAEELASTDRSLGLQGVP